MKKTWTAARQRVINRLADLIRQPGSNRVAAKPREMLEPVFVRLEWGHVGSVLLMQLLATSPEISFDRIYPFENLCLANLLYYLEPLDHPVEAPPPGGWTDDPNRTWWPARETSALWSAGFTWAMTVWASTYWLCISVRCGASGRRIRSSRDGRVMLALASTQKSIEVVPRSCQRLESCIASSTSCAIRVTCGVHYWRSTRNAALTDSADEAVKPEEEYLTSCLPAVRRRLDAIATANPNIPTIVPIRGPCL